jgi:hypothetical protein
MVKGEKDVFLIMRKKIHALLFLLTLSFVFISCLKENSNDTDDDPVQKKNSISQRLMNALNSDSIKSTVIWLEDMGTRFAFADNHRKVAVRIQDRFKRSGYYNAYLDSFLLSTKWRNQNYSTWQYNVVAQLTGSVYPDSVNILGAHYDSIVSLGDPFTKAPGANDNGSGIAAMIEIARVMKTKGYTPDNSIQFVAFAAEEVGLFGSADYAAKLFDSGKAVGIMINNDMIANVSNADRLSWTVNLKHYGNSEDLSYEAFVLCNNYTDLIPVVDPAGNNRSDSYSFFLKDFRPIYFASNSSDNNYHTLNDLAEECNFTYCTLVSKLSAVMLVFSD